MKSPSGWTALACFALVAVILAVITIRPGWVGPVVEADEAQLLSTEVLTAFAHETITVAETAIGFTAATYAPSGQISARAAECVLETGTIRDWPDGTAPSTTVGRLTAVGVKFSVFGGNNIRNWRAIRATATSGTLSCAYYR